MNSFQKVFLITLILLIFSNHSIASEAGYHFRFDDWVNTSSRILALSSQSPWFRWSEYPYDRSQFGLFLKESIQAELAQNSPSRYYLNRLAQETIFGFNRFRDREGIELMNTAHLDYAPDLNPKDKVRLINDLVGFTRIRDRLSVYFDFQFDSDGLYDSDYHGTHEWKNVVGDMRAAYFQYSAPRWSLLVGRDEVQWGPGQTGSLLTSGHAPSLDMIKLTFDIWKIRFQGFNALLAKTTDEEHDNLIHRYFSGHRLSLRLPKAEIALHETVIHGGPKQIVNPGYLNPLLPYYFADVMFNEEKVKSNVTVSLEASLLWLRNWRFYGQFLVDEYYYEREPYPNQTAYLLGCDWTGFNPLWLNFEYVRISRWVYNYRSFAPWNRLNYYNSVLGHPMGPDADLLHSEQHVYLGKNFLVRMSQNFLRNGETTVFTPLDMAQEKGNTHPPFPFGVVQKSLAVALEVEYSPSVDWFVSGAMKYDLYDNYEHDSGKSASDTFYMVALRYRWRAFLSN